MYCSVVRVRAHMCMCGALVQCSVMLIEKNSFLYISFLILNDGIMLVRSTLLHMRMQRMGLIQTEHQLRQEVVNLGLWLDPDPFPQKELDPDLLLHM